MDSFNSILAYKTEKTINWSHPDDFTKTIVNHLIDLKADVESTSQNITIKWQDNNTTYEIKKTVKGEKFNFNDTFLKEDVYYILIYVSHRKIRIEKGSKLLELTYTEEKGPTMRSHLKTIGELVMEMLGENKVSDDQILTLFSEMLGLMKAAVVNKRIRFEDYSQAFKKVISFGDFSSRPRPNWTLKFPLLENLESSQELIDNSWEIPIQN